MSDIQQDVAVFIDFENIYVSVREKFDATPNFEALMERCEDYGRVVVARAYADWYRYPRITSALFANNIEPMYVPTYYYDKDEGRTGRPIKNSVDMHMCIDAMRTLYTRTNIGKYVFITGDRDFIALVNCVRQEGKDVIIIGIGGAASGHLAQSADEFLFYEQIVDIRPMGHGGRRSSRPPERSMERPERNGRDDRRRERERTPERPPEKERTPEPTPPSPAAVQPQPIVAAPALVQPSQDDAVYDTLVEALDLARKRGYVSSFGSLKVLMKELMPNFKESRYRDVQGRPFSKFTDFVREAERLGKIQIFTSGTVNEVFMPNEDPYKLSQFAEDLPSVEAERELEEELALEAEARNEEEHSDRAERSGRRRRRRGSTRTEPAAEEILLPEEESASEEVYSFGDKEWSLFYRVMQSYKEPVPFADIFNDLRELRNTEELDLTNNGLKELIKHAINEQRLQRSNRGAKAHYRLIDRADAAQFLTQPEAAAAEAAHNLANDGDQSPLPDLDEDALELPDLDEEDVTASITEDISAAFEPARADSAPKAADQPETDQQTDAVVDTVAEAEAAALPELPTAEDVPAAQAQNGSEAVVEATPKPATTTQKPKTTRRRKKTSEEPADTAAAAEKPKTTQRRKKTSEEPADAAAAAEKPKTTRRRKKTSEEPADATAAAEKPKTTRRRRKKTSEESTTAAGEDAS